MMMSGLWSPRSRRWRVSGVEERSATPFPDWQSLGVRLWSPHPSRAGSTSFSLPLLAPQTLSIFYADSSWLSPRSRICWSIRQVAFSFLRPWGYSDAVRGQVAAPGTEINQRDQACTRAQLWRGGWGNKELMRRRNVSQKRSSVGVEKNWWDGAWVAQLVKASRLLISAQVGHHSITWLSPVLSAKLAWDSLFFSPSLPHPPFTVSHPFL